MKNLIEIANNNLIALYPMKPVNPITLDEIEKVYSRNILGINNAKTVKGDSKGYLTGILYFAPYNLSGVNVCPKASQGCSQACLFSAGRGRFYSITRQRLIKTLAYQLDKPRFIETIKKSIKSLITKANNKGLIPVVRLNGTSDILWEKTDIIESFPDIQFYDYTKIARRFFNPLDIPANYHLTFSASESNSGDIDHAMRRGVNVAVVFRGELPKVFFGKPVIIGDETDLRFLDKQGVVVALTAKGRAKKDVSGFVKDAVKSA